MTSGMYLVAKGTDGYTLDLEEGNFTYNAKTITQTGYAKGGSFASELQDGDLVEIYASADKCVQKSATGVQVGFIDGDPVGPIPGSTLSSGNYTRRQANIVAPGADFYKIQLDASNQAIVPGYYLAIDTTNKDAFDKEEDTTSNIVALESAAATSGDSILCLVYGKPAVEGDAGA